MREWNSKVGSFLYTTPIGHTFQLYPDQYVDQRIFIDGAYELRLLHLIETFFKRNSNAVMLDIGANIGNHAIYLSGSFNRIICFEPSPYIVDRLNKNIALNNLTNVEVHCVGLSNRAATLHYKLDETGNLGASHFVKTDNEDAEELPVVPGDDYLSKHFVDHVDFIKVDVEHHELEVLEGLRLTIDRDRPIVVFEFQGEYLGPEYFDGIASTLPSYIFAEAQFAPALASYVRKFIWQVRHRGIPKLTIIGVPENRFYENVIAFPDEETLREFNASLDAKKLSKLRDHVARVRI